MKRFISALVFSVSLLAVLSMFLFVPARSAAKENVIMKLLNLPAPPPPNPLARRVGQRGEKFYDKNNPPGDDAPIEDLIDYWTNQSGGGYTSDGFSVNYKQRLTGRSLDRLMAEMAKKPELASQLLDVLPNDKAAVDVVKGLYDNAGTEDGAGREERRRLREWLRLNSSYFSRDLERVSQQIKDQNNYVNQNDENNLLALTRHDFDKASPILSQLYNDASQPVSKALATWALYRRALDTDSLSDIERYRSELMSMVEDRNASEGVRDKANDAIMLERDFPGRDDWAFSLFEDETFVAITRYTASTTLIMRSPPDKYVSKLTALVEKTSNSLVRGAAVRNLIVVLRNNPGKELEIEIIKSLLAWLEDPKWAADAGDTRGAIVTKLIEHRIPESVPGLISILDEKERQPSANFAANSMANAMRPANTASLMSANANRSPGYAGSLISYPHRQSAIPALGKQKDSRAVPALRRVINEVQGYERSMTVKAILDCGGFTVVEQMAALEAFTKGSIEGAAALAAANAATYEEITAMAANAMAYRAYSMKPGSPITESEIKELLGQQLMQSEEISDELARAIVDRIEVLDEKDPRLASALRSMILKWQNAAINILLLRDVKRDVADDDTIIRLLSQRKNLREQHFNDLTDLRSGKPEAIGISACLFEDQADYAAVLENGDAEAKTAMLACARLIRAALPVATVAENLKSQNQMLQIAAERYLESEDSPEARAFVLARYPNEAMILGATSAFYVKNAPDEVSSYLWMLYQSLGDESLYNGQGESFNDEELEKTEKQLQIEVKKDLELLGVYAYDDNYIRIYKDRVIFSWDEDDSRYRERPLTKEEFDAIKSYLTDNKVDELAPFLSCGGAYCTAKELVMLGRSGGRRVYMTSPSHYDSKRPADSEFFAGLDKYFADLKLTRATLKYALSREIPGLEILLASDDLHAKTVWALGSDIRVAATDVAVRKKVESEIENTGYEEDAAENVYSEENVAKRAALTEKHRYDGFAWHKVANGEAAGIATQPAQVEYVPLRDTLAVQPTNERWKAKAGEVEVRTSSEGLYKVFLGRLTRLRKGFYQQVVITPNGRWAVAAKSGEMGIGIVRVDLVTNREYPIEIEGYGQRYPAAYVPSLNKILVVNDNRYYGDHHEGGYSVEAEDATPQDVSPADMLLLDAATGVTQPIAGEFRPLSQQTFRPLQSASKPNEFWAAIVDPEKNETQVGVYDARLFGFRPILRVPKINFNSMSMWVDESVGKVYFVYRGHLLALPLSEPPA
ncbi:MAG: hypothetical protein ACKVRN_05195 [Pyrinomonadaceae bacterium]